VNGRIASAVAVGCVSLLAACGGGNVQGVGLGRLATSTTLSAPVGAGSVDTTGANSSDATVDPTARGGPSGAVDTGTTVTTGAGGGAPAGATANGIRFQLQTFVDPAANGVTAIKVLVPQGWQASGSVRWLPLWSRLASLQTEVADPSTGISIDWLALQDFIWFPAPAGLNAPVGGNYQGKAYVPPITDPSEFVRQFWMPNALSDLQNAQLVSTVEVPAVAQEFLTQFAGPGQAHAYRMRYTYLRNGQPWERDVSFALLFSGSANLTSWYVNFAHTETAPQGQLDRDAGVISTIVASRSTTPAWEANYRLVGELFRKGLQQQLANDVAFGQLLTQYRAESARLQAQVTAERQASEDHRAQLERQILGGVQTYSDPVNSELVELPVGWKTYWVNDKGEYLAVDQPGYDPNTLNDGTWQQLQPRD